MSLLSVLQTTLKLYVNNSELTCFRIIQQNIFRYNQSHKNADVGNEMNGIHIAL